jgi:hypothetical protein
MDTIGGHNVKWSGQVAKTKIAWFLSHVEGSYKREICPPKQKWSYPKSHVEQACHSATTLWNSGKWEKERRWSSTNNTKNKTSVKVEDIVICIERCWKMCGNGKGRNDKVKYTHNGNTRETTWNSDLEYVQSRSVPARWGRMLGKGEGAWKQCKYYVLIMKMEKTRHVENIPSVTESWNKEYD